MDQLPAAPESCAKKHTVKAGDTLYLIAKMHNVKLDALMRANPHIDPYNMLVGTELCIPDVDNSTYDVIKGCPIISGVCPRHAVRGCGERYEIRYSLL